jgi:hypothetical protein
MKTGALFLGAAAGLFLGAWVLEAVVGPGIGSHAVAMAAQLIGVILMIPGAIKLAFGYWRARDAARTEVAPTSSPGALALACPCCRRATFGLKQVRLTDLTYLILGARIQHARYMSCPRCTRALVEEHLLRNLVSANLLWIAPAAQGLVALVQSFTPGHSRAVRQELQQRAARQAAGRA